MRGARIIVVLAAFGALGMAAARQSVQSAGQGAPGNSAPDSEKGSRFSSLKVCLRQADKSAFAGAALVRVWREGGEELLGIPGSAQGEFLFYAVAPGRYVVEVSAQGFPRARVKTEVDGRGGEQDVVVVLKPKAAERTEKEAEAKAETKPAETAATGAAAVGEDQRPPVWAPEALVINPNVACREAEVLRGAGQRVQELMSSLERFTARETVEHYPVDKSGDRKSAEKWEADYMVGIVHDRSGAIYVQEYRNGSEAWEKVPGNVATIGLPAMALVFHPAYAVGFNFRCEGLVSKEGRELWQVQFAQRNDRPARIESYVVKGSSYALYLQGRAWIDPGSEQVVMLETELAKPVEAIELVEFQQHIRYGPVKFVSTGQSIWLPKEAEVYVERHGRRYFRRHTFRDFKLFSVETATNVQAPKGSYSFTNLTDRDITGELTVTPTAGTKGGPITLRFPVPAHKTVVKTVGPGRDVNMPMAAVSSAKFVHSGDADAVRVDVNLARETTLDVVPEAALERP